MWTNVWLRRISVNSNARTWSGRLFASVPTATNKLVRQTTAETLTNALPIQICAKMVAVSTFWDRINATASMVSNWVLMANAVSVGFYFQPIPMRWLKCWNLKTSKYLLCFVADSRIGLCYSQLVNGRCVNEAGLKSVPRMDCCCTMGAAWGPFCQICPSPRTQEYQRLCSSSGFSVDGHGNLRSCTGWVLALSWKKFFWEDCVWILALICIRECYGVTNQNHLFLLLLVSKAT